jgi:hypothetical protein
VPNVAHTYDPAIVTGTGVADALGVLPGGVSKSTRERIVFTQ